MMLKSQNMCSGKIYWLFSELCHTDLVWNNDPIQSNGTVNFPIVDYFLNIQWIQLGPGYCCAFVKGFQNCAFSSKGWHGCQVRRLSQSLTHLTSPQQPTFPRTSSSCILWYLHLLPWSDHHLYADGFSVISISGWISSPSYSVESSSAFRMSV